MEDKRSLLKAYYDLLGKKGNDEKAAGIMSYLIGDLSDDEVLLLEEKIVENDSFYKKIEAYSDKLAVIAERGPVEDAIPYAIGKDGKNMEALAKLESAIGSYDFLGEAREEINGNTFIYKKDAFPIEQYRDELYLLGEEEKGNRWYVQLDEEGRLVIY